MEAPEFASLDFAKRGAEAWAAEAWPAYAWAAEAWPAEAWAAEACLHHSTEEVVHDELSVLPATLVAP